MKKSGILSAALVVALALLPLFCAPSQRASRLTFPHKPHVKGEEMECSECHKDVAKATAPGNFLPQEKVCLGCHSKQKANCAFCHAGSAKPAAVVRPRLRGISFSHKNHNQREKENCARCHGDIGSATGPKVVTRDERRNLCMSCHKKDYRRINCAGCHADFVETKSKPFDMFSHRGNFFARHGSAARTDSEVCSHCHTQSFCTDCHSRMAPGIPSIMRSDEMHRLTPHRGDVMITHGLEARADPGRCWGCHTQDKCTDCHSRKRVGARGLLGLGPHPGGWMRKGSGEFHGTSARRDVVSCAACHDRGPDTNCIACHRVGGSGGSPHPPGWSSRLDKGSSHMCTWCHR